MSFKSESEAMIAANKVKDQLGKQWVVKVWDNLGWHSKVSLDNMIHVYIEKAYGQFHVTYGQFHVMIGEDGAETAHLSPDWKDKWDNDPIIAVQKSIIAYKKNWDDYKDRQEKILRAGLEYISNIS